jgi:hypothetical protein
MTDTSSGRPPPPAFTADELRAAMRLIDPSTQWPDEFYERAASAPPERPWLLPLRVGVALTVVSERLDRGTDEWLATQPPAVRADFERERELLRRVARGEAPPPGWLPG